MWVYFANFILGACDLLWEKTDVMLKPFMVTNNFSILPVKSQNGYTFEVNGYSSKPMRMQ